MYTADFGMTGYCSYRSEADGAVHGRLNTHADAKMEGLLLLLCGCISFICGFLVETT